MFEAFGLPFFQRGIGAVLLLAVLAGFLGTWIVLRGMAFLAHASGAATFPGVVLADGLGFAVPIGAFAGAAGIAAAVGMLAARRRAAVDSATALMLVGALALGVVLASDVFGSQAGVDRMLFGSLLTIGTDDLLLAAAVALCCVWGTRTFGGRWLRTGFSGEQSGDSGDRRADAALMLLIALAAVSALAATGALLATAILVVPAATTRLLTNRLPSWRAATVALAAAEGVLGMWLAYEMNVPPGAAIAVLAGAVFALVAVATRLRPRRPVALAAGLAATAAIAGCGGDGSKEEASAPAITVVGTTTQVGDLLRQVGGEDVSVRPILQPNSEAHDYEPRPEDVKAVADADLVFTSGLGLDPWARDLIENAGSEAKVIELGDKLPVELETGEAEEEHGHADEHGKDEHGHEHGETDPHWWHDPRNVEAAATTVERALVTAAPQAREQIEGRAAAYRRKAAAVDRAIARCIDRIPKSERVIATDHDAFAYFTGRYGIRSVGAIFPATSTGGQPSAGELAELERTIRRENVKAVFPENSLSSKLTDRLAQDTGIGAGRELYGDTLGPADSPEGTILGAAAANADAIVAGLSGGELRCEIPT